VKPPRPRLVDVIFGLAAPERRWRVGVALALALLAHGGLWGWTWMLQPSLETWAAGVAARVHAEHSRVEVVELPPPRPPARPPPPAPSPAPAATRQRPAAPEPTPAGPPPPAQAASVVARVEAPGEPVDLTATTFVTGSAEAFAGGATSTTGTGAGPGGGPTASGPPGESDRSSPVSLEGDQWDCPWPPEAEAEDLLEQLVVLQVRVRADGRAEAAQVLADPGHGFGAAAQACALTTRFQPARGRDGRPVAAASPPLRVRFLR
jgi:periplasmic protein TonB